MLYLMRETKSTSNLSNSIKQLSHETYMKKCLSNMQSNNNIQPRKYAPSHPRATASFVTETFPLSFQTL